jgi:homoserine kinase
VTIVRVPASSANLGPGFDALGMALGLHLEAAVPGACFEGPEVDARHPAQVAFARLGGEGTLRVRSPIPMGRGLGFSGAARVAGLAAALAQRGDDVDPAVLLAHASELEGHADNVAASIHGGVVATAGGRCVRVPLALDPAVVVWVPQAAKTSTDESRGRLPTTVSLADASFNLGRAALLVAALAAGDVSVLGHATEDRLHQEVRFRVVPGARAALDAALAAGAWCGWLSGSGPSVACLCAVDQAEAIAAALPTDGPSGAAHAKVLRIDHAGVVVEAG